MKQVININYHGRIIPIEIAAHDLLKAYIAGLQKHFENFRKFAKNDVLRKSNSTPFLLHLSFK
mgnify:CR=1 FL=1